jgi:TonB family protein
MGIEQNPPISDQESASDAQFRAVRLQRTRAVTFFSAACEVKGSLCFVRSDKRGQSAWLIRLLRLTPPEPFSDGIAVFGLRGATLDALRNDGELVRAVDALLKMGTRLSLQGNKLVANIGNGHASASEQALTHYVGLASLRIEKLIGSSANDAIGTNRIIRPYTIYSIVSAAIFGVCSAISAPTLTPLKIAVSSVALGLVLGGIAVALILSAHLRRHLLAGAVVSTSVLCTLVGSVCLGSSLAMIGNVTLGTKFLPGQDLHLAGAVIVTHGRHASCWLNLNQVASNIVPGESIKRLPIQCTEVRFRADRTAHLYDVDINPGLLGAPFIQSIKAEDADLFPQYVSADLIPCYYGLPTDRPLMLSIFPLHIVAAVRASIDAQGKVRHVVLEMSSGNANFDDLAVRQSLAASCKSFSGPDGQAIPVDTNFVFTNAPPVVQPVPQPVPILQTFAGKVAQRVNPLLVWNASMGSVQTVISVHCAPDGKLLSASIIRSSGNRQWDSTALEAVRHSDPMPADASGKTPEHFTLTISKKPPPAQAGGNNTGLTHG